jgi:acyl-CoA thioesterase-1
MRAVAHRAGGVVASLCALLFAGACAGHEVPSPPYDAETTATPRIALSSARAAPATTAQDAASTPPVASSRGSGSGIRYVALGDSFTIGTGSSPEDAFPARLVHEWAACPVSLTNFAKNGFTTADVLSIEVPRLLDGAPTFVTFAAGANDIVQRVPELTYRKNAASIFSAIREAGVSPERTIALPQPDWSLSPAAASFGDPHMIAARIERYNVILKEEAQAAGARYVDLFPLMRELAMENEIASDGLHPSKKAHAAWAKALAVELGPCAAFE